MVVILTLQNFLKDNRNARKIFGKKELGIIFKQLNGIKMTQSERNRLSRDIKPKLEFIKVISKFQDEFKLQKNQENKKRIDIAVNVILNDILKEDIKAILLFGSFADNSFTANSDIDICVLFKKTLSLKEATKFRIRILGQLPDKFDVQVFNILPQKIKRNVARNHRVLFKSKEHNNINFFIKYIKDDDYFIRLNKLFN